MKRIHRTVLQILAGAALAAMLFIITAPPRGHTIVLQPAPTASPLTVHIAGSVNSPGVYQLPRGSRLSAGVEAAGGFTEAADQEAVNLAAVLNDADKWVIPEVGSAVTEQIPPLINQTRGSEPVLTLVNINTADAEELETLPGIGPVLAQDIVTYRETNGVFEVIEDVLEVPGIGPAKFDAMKDFITAGG